MGMGSAPSYYPLFLPNYSLTFPSLFHSLLLSLPSFLPSIHLPIHSSVLSTYYFYTLGYTKQRSYYPGPYQLVGKRDIKTNKDQRRGEVSI